VHRVRSFVLIALAALACACAGDYGHGRLQGGSRVVVRGSDTLVLLLQHWAQRYATVHPSVSIDVSGGGTGTGIASLVNGTTDVASASRAMTSAERSSIEAAGAETLETKVALDAVAIYVHASNPIAALGIDQLKAIFQGRIRRWADVGGADAPIVLYSRENSSGTYLFFKEHVLGKEDFAAEVQCLPGTASVVQAVMHDPNAIGYGGIAAGAGVRALALRGASGAVVAPSRATASDGSYPLARPLFVYRRSDASAAAGDFVAWLITDEAQAVAETSGFYPLRQEIP